MDDDTEVKCPYDVGTILNLKAEGKHGVAFSCKIVKLFKPFTQSCVMEVEVLGVSSPNPRAVLKLFDRRFAMGLRINQPICYLGPLTAAREKSFSDFVKSGGASEFSYRLWNEAGFESTHDEWDMNQLEAYMYNWLCEKYETEAQVYGKLRKPQGREIPSLLAEVRLQTGSPDDDMASSDTESSSENIFEVKGLLLEHIEGYLLSNLTKNAPRKDWGRICDQAVQVVRLLDDFNIRNEDVRRANIVISPIPSGNRYRVVVIDFGHCVMRKPDKSDKEWNRAKWDQDEEGAIGLVMKKRLKKVGYDWPFVHSNKFWEWASREDDSP